MTMTAPEPVATVQCSRCRQQRDPSEFGTYQGHPIRFYAQCRERTRQRAAGRLPIGLGTDPVADRHAARSVLGRAGASSGYYHPPDPIETSCPACTLRWSGDGWTHDPGCMMRSAAL